MAEDRNSTSDEGVDHGVLDEVSTSTTAIDLGATAQVNVILPVGYRDDDRDDDDVIADELSADEIARHELEADASVVDDADPGDEVADADPEAGANAAGGFDAEDEGDEPESDEANDAKPAEEDDSNLEDSDAADDDATHADAAEGGAADEAQAEEPADGADDDALADIDEPAGGADADTGADEPAVDADSSADDAALEEAAIDEDELEEPASENAAPEEDPTDAPATGDASDEDAPDESAQGAEDDHTAESRDDEVAAKEDFAEHIDELMATATNTVTLEATATDPSIAILREAATTKEPLMVKEHSPIPAAVSADTASRVEEAAHTGRPSFIKSHARGGASEQAAPQSAPEESAVLTDARLLETGAIRKPVPVDPWRRILHSITGGVINLRDGKATRERAALKARIGARIDGRARFVPVMSRKGGVGKTTVTALLGMALADARDDRVVAVDANPDRGTLAERIAKPSGKTVRDLVRDSDQIHGYGDMSAHVTRDETRLDVLASDTDPHVADAFNDDDYRAVADIAQHYYSLVLTDTGTGIVHSVMSATLDLADQLVIVSGVSIDEARLASETLTWLEANGRGELAQNAIVVINQEAAGKTHVRIDEVESHFRSRVRDVVRIPYDPAIATGSAISFHELAQPTRDAARRLAALVVEGIRA